MPIVGAAEAEPLRSLLVSDVLADAPWFDAHTHIGQNDPDGFSATVDELIGGLDAAGHQRALVFPMHEPDGYRAANDDVLAAADGSGGRLIALARVDPNHGDAVDEARRCLSAGGRGIKLHPRSDAFALPHPTVAALVALAAEHRAIVLFHAGRGIPRLGASAASMAREHPDARIVLAHAGISDIVELAPVIAELPNLFFDTAWWQVSDFVQMFVSAPPGQILYGSDMPYGPGLFTAFALERAGLAVGLDDDTLREIAGGQLGRLIAGDDPVDLGPARGSGPLGARSISHERVVSHLTTAVTGAWMGVDPGQSLALARLAIADGADPVLALVDTLIERAQEQHAVSQDDVRAGIFTALCAQFLAGTPTAGMPR